MRKCELKKLEGKMAEQNLSMENGGSTRIQSNMDRRAKNRALMNMAGPQPSGQLGISMESMQL